MPCLRSYSVHGLTELGQCGWCLSINCCAVLTFCILTPCMVGSSHWYGSLGIGMGAQESVMRAALAEMIPTERRGVAYGFSTPSMASLGSLEVL